MKGGVLNELEIDSVIAQTEGLILVELYYPNSGISIIMEPLLIRIRKSYKTRLRHFKLDVSKGESFLLKYHLDTSASILIFYNNELLEIISGLVSYEMLENAILNHLEKSH